MGVKKIMTARRYAEHMRKAEAFLQTYNYLKENNFVKHECIKLFKPEDFLVGTVESSVSAIEAFINQLGYIFVDTWKEDEGKNFWHQYKKVIKTLEELGINVSHILKTPYPAFENHRGLVRNPLHHVQSSKHDIQSVERKLPLDVEIDFQESSDMLNCWIDISYEKAIDAYNQAVSFIQYFQKEFENKYFYSDPLSEILSRRRIDSLACEERQELLRRYIEDPLNPLALVSGNYTFEPQSIL